MREYNPIELPETDYTIKIDNLPPFDILDYDLTDDKDIIRYLKDIERICRNSRCYKKMINFLREYVDMSKCSFYENINNLDTYSIKIHIHHAPLTLYDIVSTIYSKRVACGESLSVSMVAKEVMFNHYKMVVGLIPLSETVHELVHNGYLFIPTTNVFGNYKGFISVYEKYMNPELLATLRRAEEISKTYDYSKETKILEFHPVYIDTTGAYQFPNKEEIIELMSKKIKDIEEKCLSVQNIEVKENG